MKTIKTIRNCNVSFEFVCPLTWDKLNATEDNNIRFCGECQRQVFFCSMDEETITHARAGDCIAREMPEDNSRNMIIIGRPSIEEIREDILREHYTRKEKAVDEAINLNSIFSCSKCGYPKKDELSACEVCRCG